MDEHDKTKCPNCENCIRDLRADKARLRAELEQERAIHADLSRALGESVDKNSELLPTWHELECCNALLENALGRVREFYEYADAHKRIALDYSRALSSAEAKLALVAELLRDVLGLRIIRTCLEKHKLFHTTSGDETAPVIDRVKAALAAIVGGEPSA